MLQSGSQVKVLATSREHLRVAGETTYPVPALAAPDPQKESSATTLSQYAAVRMFLDRASAAQPAFKVTSANAKAVAEICHRLDGIPLALELAAARVRALSVENIAVRLSNRFHLLTGGDRTALPRQQTLRASIDWSYDLLTTPERTLLRRFAIFSGGWTLEAAEAVAAFGDVDESDVLDLLTRLVADIEELQNFYLRVVSPIVIALMISLFTFGIFSIFSIGIAWVALAFLILTGLGVPWLSELLSRGLGKQQVKARAELNIQIVDGLQGIQDVLAFGCSHARLEGIAACDRALGQVQRRMARITGSQIALGDLLMNTAMWVLIILAIPLVSTGYIDGVYLGVIGGEPPTPKLALSSVKSLELTTSSPLKSARAS